MTDVWLFQDAPPLHSAAHTPTGWPGWYQTGPSGAAHSTLVSFNGTVLPGFHTNVHVYSHVHAIVHAHKHTHAEHMHEHALIYRCTHTNSHVYTQMQDTQMWMNTCRHMGTHSNSQHYMLGFQIVMDRLLCSVLGYIGFFALRKDVCVGVSLYLCRSVGHFSRQPMHGLQEPRQLLYLA